MSSSVGFQLWHSPIPYVFGGLIVAMGLMVTALVVLACSHCKSAEGNDNSISRVEAPAALVPLEREPTLMVVIMAGDDKPSFLAKPFDAHNCSTRPLQSSGYLCPTCLNNQG